MSNECKLDDKSKPSPKRPVQLPSAERSTEGQRARRWDGVDESVWESFPSSDAPVGWAGRDLGGPPAPVPEEKADPDLDEEV
jgi:hypothetical protein